MWVPTMSFPKEGSVPPVDLRSPTSEERRVLAALLSVEFPGRSELVEQAKDVLARTIDTEGSIAFVAAGGRQAPVVRRIPVEAELEDADGTTIHILLHVIDGRLNELEIYRDDSAPIQGVIDPERFHLIVL